MNRNEKLTETGTQPDIPTHSFCWKKAFMHASAYIRVNSITPQERPVMQAIQHNPNLATVLTASKPPFCSKNDECSWDSFSRACTQ